MVKYGKCRERIPYMEPEKNNGFSKEKSQKTVPFFQVMSCLLWEGWFSYDHLAGILENHRLANALI